MSSDPNGAADAKIISGDSDTRLIERRLRPRDEKILSDEKVGSLAELPSGGASIWVPGPRDNRFSLEAETLADMLDRFCSTHTLPEHAPSVVVFVAHPDDEAIGAGARLSGLPNTYIVHTTDGAPSSIDYVRSRGYSSREEYATTRRKEVINALALAGIDEDHILCMNITDGDAYTHLVELSYAVADIIEELQPEIVLTHPYEGGHSDHDATAFAVHLACGILRRDGAPSPVVLELTSYHSYMGSKRVGEFLPYNRAGQEYPVAERTVELTPDMVELKKQMYGEFESQRKLLNSFPVKHERFRPAPRYAFTVPPHPGQLNYEISCNRLTGEEWRARAAEALEHLRARRTRSSS